VVLEASADGRLISGMRIQIAHGEHGLPTERAYTGGGEVCRWVAERRASGVGEVCGAWADPVLARSPVFPLVTCAAFSLLAPLGARTALLSCGEHSQRVLLDVGLEVETRLGDRGRFYYPTPTSLSFFMVLPDTEGFAGARPDYRRTILDLRARPRQHRRLESPRLTAEIEVDLTIAG
jgi:hypothetical protein